MQPLENQYLLFFMFLTISSFEFVGAAHGKRSSIANTIVVDQNGRGNFTTIQAAINFVPSGNSKWIKIQINSGKYTEQVTIPLEKPYIFLQGEGRHVTIITYNAHQRTDTSATFTSQPANVKVNGITFMEIVPAVAARIYGDKSVFYECGFIGVQDTLWDVEGRHYFYNCYIEGATDFIFGNGQTIYEACSLNATVPSTQNTGYITAQGRASRHDPSGFVFKGGVVFGSSDAKVLLGRAYGPYSRVIFIGKTLTSVVDPLGWCAWNYQGHEDNFTYSEANCRGPGSNTSKRVQWEKKLDANQLSQFAGLNFINRDGWIRMLPQD